jgi:hypothetical protein
VFDINDQIYITSYTIRYPMTVNYPIFDGVGLRYAVIPGRMAWDNTVVLNFKIKCMSHAFF